MSPSKEFLIKILTNARDRHLKRKQFGDHGSRYVKTTYVCHAIRNAMDEAGQGWKIPTYLAMLVEGHIGRGTVVDGFLAKKFGRRKVKAMSYEQIQDWRALLLNNMIEIVKKECK